MVASAKKMPLFIALRLTTVTAFIGLVCAACGDDDENPDVSPGFGAQEAGGPARAPGVVVEAAAPVDSAPTDTGTIEAVDLGLSASATICAGTGCPQIFGSCPYTFGELTIGAACEELMECAYCNNGQEAGWKINCTRDRGWVAVEYCD